LPNRIFLPSRGRKTTQKHRVPPCIFVAEVILGAVSGNHMDTASGQPVIGELVNRVPVAGGHAVMRLAQRALAPAAY
jgi:hypothetical protein